MLRKLKNNKMNNDYKKSLDPQIVSMEDIIGKNLIPTELVLYGVDEENNEVNVYILNTKKTKLKTFESFKNKDNATVRLITYAANSPAAVSTVGPIGYDVYYADTGYKYNKETRHGYSSQMKLEWCLLDKEVALFAYRLVYDEETKDVEYRSFTTIEAIEKFIEEKNTLLKAKALKEINQKNRCESFIENTIDKSLNF